jgi:hypothetical protein
LRWKNIISKIHDPISFGMTFDLHTESGVENYDLISVVEHIGQNFTNGHYVSHCRCNDNSWVTLNDGTVTPISAASALGKQAYLIFYSKISDLEKQIRNQIAIDAEEEERKRVAAAAIEQEKRRLAAAEEQKRKRVAVAAIEQERKRVAAAAIEQVKRRLSAIEQEKKRMVAVEQQERKRVAAADIEQEKRRMAVESHHKIQVSRESNFGGELFTETLKQEF